MSDDSRPHDSVTNLERRDLLRQFGVGGAAAVIAGLSGCSGDDGSDGGSDGSDGDSDGNDGGSDGNDGGSTGSPVDSVISVPTPRVPSDVHWNNYNPTSLAGATRNWVEEYLVGYSQANQEFVPSPILDDLTVDGKTMTITVADGVTWHSGNEITAEDIVTRIKLDQIMNQPISDVVNSAKTTSKKVAELSLDTENKDIALGVLAGEYFNTPTSVYGDFITRFEDAGSDDERDAIRGEIVGFTTEEIGSGPFKITEATSRRFTAEPHEGHPAYDAIQDITLEATKTTGNQGILQMAIADEIDYIGPVVLSADALSQIPDHFQRFPTSNLNGHGLFWNHENKHIARRKFRQAIAFVTDRKRIAENAAGLNFKAPVGTPTGISGVRKGIPESWLGNEIENFTAYKTNTDKAAKLLREADYTKSDGTWHGPNGDPVKLELVYPGGWTDWVNAGQTLNSQLNNFGIQTDLRTVDAPTWNGKTFPNGEFDITPRFWGGGRPHPFFGFRAVSNSDNQQNANIPKTVEVPMPVGDPNGSLEEVNMADLTSQIPQSSGEEAKELVLKLAWAVNQSLAVLPIMEKIGNVWWTTDDWQVPSEDDPSMSVNPPTHLTWPFHEGNVEPKRQ